MKKPNLRITLEQEATRIEVLTSDVIAEVRDYWSQKTIAEHSDDWVDENGRSCLRYFVARKGTGSMPQATAADLQRFADDLQAHGGIQTTFAPEEAIDGLHVLTINNVDYYFCTDGCGYDGWGKEIGRGSS